MDFGADIIGMVKNKTKIFCKDTIDNLTNNCPGGSYLVLRSKHMVPGGRLIISIDYKYNV